MDAEESGGAARAPLPPMYEHKKPGTGAAGAGDALTVQPALEREPMRLKSLPTSRYLETQNRMALQGAAMSRRGYSYPRTPLASDGARDEEAAPPQPLGPAAAASLSLLRYQGPDSESPQRDFCLDDEDVDDESYVPHGSLSEEEDDEPSPRPVKRPVQRRKAEEPIDEAILARIRADAMMYYKLHAKPESTSPDSNSSDEQSASDEEAEENSDGGWGNEREYGGYTTPQPASAGNGSGASSPVRRTGRARRARFDASKLAEMERELDEALCSSEHSDGSSSNDDSSSSAGERQLISPIMDHRDVDGGREYLVKWNTMSHRYCFWVDQNWIEENADNGKVSLTNYKRMLKEYADFMQRATPEEAEAARVNLERYRELLEEYKIPERIIADRKSDEGAQEYLIKWKSLPYRYCAWDSAESLQGDQAVIDKYIHQRNLRRTRPRDPDVTRDDAVVHSRRIDACDVENFPWLPGGTLRKYQAEALRWLLSNQFGNSGGGILADEMGLGKTVQIVAHLQTNAALFGVKGPFLLVVPLSTIDHWMAEFAKWAPDRYVVNYTGDQESRELIREFEWWANPESQNKSVHMFEALVTTYEIAIRDADVLSQVWWSMMVIDEAHRLKNADTVLYRTLVSLRKCPRFLLTGTPIQNSLGELWSLLNFIKPGSFGTRDQFCERFPDTMTPDKVDDLHGILKTYMLRRTKRDVETELPRKTEKILRVPMSKIQAEFYRLILSRSYEELTAAGNRSSLCSLLWELRKCCGHADLVGDVTRENTAEGILLGSSKLQLLDQLLRRHRERGDRVLIFSQMVTMLDILGSFLTLRGFRHQRIDGTCTALERARAIAQFNAPDSKDFCFLISTRAGGLGINLTSANIVVLFDSDWNPQNDIQAMARCHRIGQTREVKVFRLVTADSVEERMIERAKEKMVLDQVVIQGIQSSIASAREASKSMTKEDLQRVLQFGAAKLFEKAERGDNDAPGGSIDLDDILAEAESADLDAGNAADSFLSSFQVQSVQLQHGNSAKEEEKQAKEFWQRVLSGRRREQAAVSRLRLRTANYANAESDSDASSALVSGGSSSSSDDVSDDEGSDEPSARGSRRSARQRNAVKKRDVASSKRAARGRGAKANAGARQIRVTLKAKPANGKAGAAAKAGRMAPRKRVAKATAAAAAGDDDDDFATAKRLRKESDGRWRPGKGMWRLKEVDLFHIVDATNDQSAAAEAKTGKSPASITGAYGLSERVFKRLVRLAQTNGLVPSTIRSVEGENAPAAVVENVTQALRREADEVFKAVYGDAAITPPTAKSAVRLQFYGEIVNVFPLIQKTRQREALARVLASHEEERETFRAPFAIPPPKGAPQWEPSDDTALMFHVHENGCENWAPFGDKANTARVHANTVLAAALNYCESR